jgi:hypothetical protein
MARQPDLLPDWFVGGAGKRRLLRALLLKDAAGPPWDSPPPWTKKQLADAAGLHEKHTVHRHVEVLVEAGLLQEHAGRYRLNTRSPLCKPLRSLVLALDRLPDAELPASRGGTPRPSA